jgi:hypothetical protein
MSIHRVMSVFARFGAMLLTVVLLATACRVDTGDVAIAITEPRGSAGTAAPSAPGVDTIRSPEDALPIIGPVPGASHWHAAYVVRICDDVLAPFDSTDDPLGIHSHADGLMHVHPFFEESGYEGATLQVFADAMGLKIGDGELTLPGGGTWRDGDLCNGVPSRVFVDRWRDPNPESEVERIVTGIDELRYLADGELYQLAFAPIDSPPVVPPAAASLDQVSNLSAPPEPWIVVSEGSSSQARLWQVAGVDASPCSEPAIPEQVLSGPVRCFTPADDTLSANDAVVSARAVMFNRSPAVEIDMAGPLRDLIASHFRQTDAPMGLGIEVGGSVVTAPLISRPPVANRLVVSGGFTVESATALATALSS